MVLYSNLFFPFCYLLLEVMASVGAIATIFFLRRIFFVFQKVKNNAKAGQKMGEDLIVFFTAVGALFPLGFLLQQMVSDSVYFQIFDQRIQNRIGAGLLCGFIGAAKLGYLRYLFLVPRLFFDNFEDSLFIEHHQKRVAAIISFVIGQSFQFLFFYENRLFESLFKRNFLLRMFLTFFVFEAFWTHERIVKNWKYLYKTDKRKKVVKRILFLQLEFVTNPQLGPSELHISIQKQNLIVSILFQRYLGDKVFVGMSFVGRLLGHIVLSINFRFPKIISIGNGLGISPYQKDIGFKRWWW